MDDTRHEGSIPFTRSPLQSPVVGKELEKVYGFLPVSSASGTVVETPAPAGDFKPRFPTKFPNERIYFIRALGSDFVKIGYASQSVRDRLSSLQCGCPLELRIMAEVRAARMLEGIIHSVFHSNHVRGEWFEMDDNLFRFIRTLTTAQEWGICIDTLSDTWELKLPRTRRGMARWLDTEFFRNLPIGCTSCRVLMESDWWGWRCPECNCYGKTHHVNKRPEHLRDAWGRGGETGMKFAAKNGGAA